MNLMNLRVSFRPIRVGWCVRLGNLEDVRRVLRWTHTIWGGRYNPIIPVDASVEGKKLVSRFRVDALYPAVDDSALKAFANSFPHLRWPEFQRGHDFFEEWGAGKESPLADISHPVSRVHRDHVKGEANPRITARLFHWEAADPLADVLLAQFGAYPSPGEAGVDYAKIVMKLLAGKSVDLPLNAPLPADALSALTPSKITMLELEGHNRFSRRCGFYIGDAGSFEDIVNFWNLRAAAQGVLFFDPKREARFKALRDSYVKFLEDERNEDDRLGLPPVSVWSAKQDPEINGKDFGEKGVIIAGTIARFLTPEDSPLIQGKSRSTATSVSEDRNRTIVSVLVPEKPTAQDVDYSRQKLVIGIAATSSLRPESGRTLATPNLPELNEFYRQQMLLAGDDVRVQPRGFGIIDAISTSTVSFFALHTAKVISEFFRLFGIQAEPSEPGKIASRLIHQMGGLQGCRPFKFPGVRNLIEKYGPLQSFTRGTATSMIAQVSGSRPTLPPLYVEGGLLTPTTTFDYLLSKRVFRAGLELLCPNCNLPFWLALEPLAHEVTCDLCGETFNLASQLKDRDWRFRRSGLFGKDNHQEGAIPVALTLQQLDTNLSLGLGFRIFATSFTLGPAGANIKKCETDIVVLDQDYAGNIEVAIGECKSRGSDPKCEISDDDVNNLSAVASAFPADRITVYLVFAKTGDFSAAEISRCEALEKKHPGRVIMLSARELEFYHVFERTAQEFKIRAAAISLKDLAHATPDIFFSPKIKAGGRP